MSAMQLLTCPYCSHSFEPQGTRVYEACPGCERAERLQQSFDSVSRQLDQTWTALRGMAKHELGEAFGKDAGPCWCDPFYRGEEWPGHDANCTAARAALDRGTE